MIPFFLDSIEIIRDKDLFDSALSPNKSVHPFFVSSKIIFFLPETNSLCVRYLSEREEEKKDRRGYVDDRRNI